MNRLFRTIPAAPGFVIAILIAMTGHGYEFKGQASILLSSPLKDTLASRIKSNAQKQARYQIIVYLRERGLRAIDTTNPVHRYHLNNVLNNCIRNGTENSYFVQREWTYSISLSTATLDSILTCHNRTCDSLAALFRKRTQSIDRSTDLQTYYSALVSCAFYAHGCFYDTTTQQHARIAKLQQLCSDSLTSFSSHIRYENANPVIAGKTGFPPDNIPKCHIYYDSLPLAGMPLKVTLPPHRTIYSGRSGAGGNFSFAQCKIPYVRKGTFVYVSTAPERAVDKPLTFSETALGIDRNEYPNNQMMLNVRPARYVLNFRASSASDVTMPEKFKQGDFLHSFFKDSCNILPKTDETSADLRFEIACQVTKYSSDETEKTDVTIMSRIIIAPLTAQNGRTTKLDTVLNHRTYNYFSEELNIGVFFWDAAAQLKQHLQEMLARL